MKKIITVENLNKYYHQLKAVDNLSFDVYEGEILGLLGPNGSGKSTTINCLLSLLSYQSGTVRIFDKEMTPSSYDIKKELGVIFQDVAVFEELTVYENIDYFCGLYISSLLERKKCIEEAIELVGLGDFKDFYPKQLSGGLLRRLNIACGIAHKPRIIILDEPTVAVDPQSRNNILEGIRTLRDNGATIIYTTHYMEEVESLCDRVIILDKGKILAEGTCDELKKLVKNQEKITIEVPNLDGKYILQMNEFDSVGNVMYDDPILSIEFQEGNRNILKIIEFLNKEKIDYRNIYSERPTLNDVFLELTGKELRD